MNLRNALAYWTFLGIWLALAPPQALLAHAPLPPCQTADTSKTYRLECVFINMNSLKPEPNVTVTVTNRQTNTERTFTTDSTGKISCSLKQASAYLISGHKPRFFNVKPVAISTMNREADEPFELQIPIKKMEMNVLYRINVKFPVNGHQLYPEMTEELDYLLDYVLKPNPKLVIEIAVHTDARGDDEYNMVLSQKRAESITEYFSYYGISEKRVIAKGYGESRLINQCENGVRCSAQLHAQNRRVEFRILSFE